MTSQVDISISICYIELKHKKHIVVQQQGHKYRNNTKHKTNKQVYCVSSLQKMLKYKAGAKRTNRLKNITVTEIHRYLRKQTYYDYNIYNAPFCIFLKFLMNY